MVVSIGEQIAMFIGSITAGFFMGIFFDFLRAINKILRLKRMLPFLDVFFWTVSLCLAFASIFITGDGSLRGFAFFGFMCGVSVYMLLLSKPTIRYMVISLGFLKNFLGKLIGVLSKILSPIKLVFNKITAFLSRIIKLVQNLQKNSIILLKKHLKKI